MTHSNFNKKRKTKTPFPSSLEHTKIINTHSMLNNINLLNKHVSMKICTFVADIKRSVNTNSARPFYPDSLVSSTSTNFVFSCMDSCTFYFVALWFVRYNGTRESVRIHRESSFLRISWLEGVPKSFPFLSVKFLSCPDAAHWSKFGDSLWNRRFNFCECNPRNIILEAVQKLKHRFRKLVLFCQLS